MPAFLAGAALKSVPWKWVGIGALVLGTVAYIGWLKVDVANLETEVAEKETQITELKGTVTSQNNAVEQWRLIASAKQEAAEDALAEVLEQKNQVNDTLARLDEANAQTCEEGIQLIDETLGL